MTSFLLRVIQWEVGWKGFADLNNAKRGTLTVESEASAPLEPRMIPRVSIAEMVPQVRDLIATTGYDLFWTDDWTPEFYRAQARLGFIAVAAPGPEDGGHVLVPELQQSYAVLRWPDLRIDRGVRKILESGRLEREGIRLQISEDPGAVLARLTQTWGARAWLVPEYCRLAGELASEVERAADPGFRLLASILVSGNEPVSGELGYAVGRAYVSLSGFFRRERTEWNHFGKLQMVLLARRLEAAGFAFWNLGHPYMEYKTRLGATVVSRIDFLPLWDSAAGGVVPDLGP